VLAASQASTSNSQRKCLVRSGYLLIAIVGTLAGCQSFVAPQSAGYESSRIVDGDRPIHLHLWYPTDQKESAVNYGISAGSAATGAKPAGDRLPIVLLSHGAMGAASNYSWIAESLARHRYVVLGVSHFGESPVFGAQSVNPAAVARFRDRTHDFNVALDWLLTKSRLASAVDASRIAAIGHSSGGATALMLAGAGFSPSQISAYCGSGAARVDKGCWYGMPSGAAAERQLPEPASRPIRAVVALDPAVGPGFVEDSLRNLKSALLVVGSVENDFLPYEAHAGRIAKARPDAEVRRLDRGEGHFVYVDTCAAKIVVMGTPLCTDRAGVDRAAVHAKLDAVIEEFLSRQLANPGLQRSPEPQSAHR
jgi:predicted dienelactone hydrolase